MISIGTRYDIARVCDLGQGGIQRLTASLQTFEIRKAGFSQPKGVAPRVPKRQMRSSDRDDQ